MNLRRSDKSSDPTSDTVDHAPDLTAAASSLRIFSGALRSCAKKIIPVLRAGWPLLLALQAFELLTDQYFDFISEMIQRRGIENLALVAGTALLEFLVSLFFTAVWFLALIPLLRFLADDRGIGSEANVKPRLGLNLRRSLNQLLIEETRVFAAILWRVPLLLLPSPIEYVRLSLVPYVVVLDPHYQAGHRDALKTSRALARGRWLLLSGTLLLSIVGPFILKEWIAGEGNIWLWEQPLRVIISGLAQFFANLAASMILFSVYEALAKGEERC